ncbi:AGE family epimerase/isomerase [Candidatus Latescibacterota bacterium]
MKRRSFIGSSVTAGISGVLFTSCGKGQLPEEYGISEDALLPDTIAGMSLEQLREDYHHRLFDLYLPFWDKGGYDEELGGFMCILNDDGTVADDEKYIWYQGRALWVYSFLYNNFGGDPRHLEIAQKTRDFMVKHMKAENGTWYEKVHRDGSIKEDVSDNIYGWLFAANGLAEFYKATQNDEDLKMIYDTIWAALRTYDNASYYGVKNNGGLPRDISFTGFRAQGHSMALIRLLTQFLSHKRNRKFEEILKEHVDLVMTKFFYPKLGITNEFLQHNYSRIPGYSDYMYTGHSLETMWMIMFEAIRTKDMTLFIDAKNIIRRYIEMSWDYVFDGFGDGHFYVLDGPGRTREKLYGVKSMWSHCEVMIACLHILEYTGEQWAKECYERARAYSLKAFDTEYGVWRQAVDRLGREVKREGVSANRKGNFHQPRYLMLNLLCIERMIENNGELSKLTRGFF